MRKLLHEVYLTLLFGLPALVACSGRAVPMQKPTLPAVTHTITTTIRSGPRISQTLQTSRRPTATSAQPAVTPSVQITTLSIRQLRMFDASQGWALDESGKILWTNQGIESWQDVSPPAPDEPLVTTAFFLDTQTAYVAFETTIKPLSNTSIWRTEDGGRSWDLRRAGTLHKGGALLPFQLYFINVDHGWLYSQVGEGMYKVETTLLETRNGGIEWEVLMDSIQAAQTNPDRLQGTYSAPYGNQVLIFISDKTGFISTDQLWKTVDGGTNWQPQAFPTPVHRPSLARPWETVSPASFSSPNHGVLLLRIYDFEQVIIPPGDLFEGPPRAQYLYTTQDGGRSWTPKETPTEIGTPTFLNSDIGWFLGKEDPSPSIPARLYFTSDGGDNWKPVESETPLPLGSAIQLINEQIGFAHNPYAGALQNPYHQFDLFANTQSYLYHTRDGGVTWDAAKPRLVD